MILLDNRAVISISGNDKHDFLQGLITNDINKVSENNSIYSAMLSPQGKYLFDFFIYNEGEKLLLDCEKNKLAALLKKLTMYKLRANVDLENLSEEYLIYSDVEKGITDPRDAQLGKRFITTEKQPENGKLDDYEIVRINLKVPDSKDFIQEKSFILQYRFEELNGVDYEKGCYVGQEVTARTHYKGTIRKTLFRVEAKSELPEIETEIIAEGKKVGIMLSSIGNTGLGLCDIESVANGGNFVTNNIDIVIK